MSLSAIPRLRDDLFLAGFLSNLLATASGILLGVPIAFWISRNQQKQQDERELIAKNEERKVKQERILNLLKVELSHNLTVLLERLDGIETKMKKYINFPGAKNEIWLTLSEGGELGSLDNLELLGKISHSYYYVRWIIELEKPYFDPIFSQSAQRKIGRESYDTIMGIDTIEAMQKILPEAIENLKTTLTEFK